MANICSTTYTIRSTKEDINRLYLSLEEAMEMGAEDRDRNLTGGVWLGRLLEYVGLSDNEIEQVACRGTIEFVDKDDYELTIDADTAWNPQPTAITMLVDNIAPDSDIYFVATEPGAGIFDTNDPEIEGMFIVDNCGESSVGRFALGDWDYWAPDNLMWELEEVLGHKGDIYELIAEAEERYEDLRFHEMLHADINDYC